MFHIFRSFSFEEKSSITSIILHPRGRKILMNVANTANETNSIRFLDIESFEIIKIVSEKELQHPQTFTITPCGTYLFISTDNNIIEIENLLTQSNSNVEQIPVAYRKNSKNFICNLDYHPKDSFLCFAVYGPNGGIFIYEYESYPIHNYSRQKSLPSISSWENRKKLRDIIQRIDDVFLIPHLTKKQTSLEKVVEKAQQIEKAHQIQKTQQIDTNPSQDKNTSLLDFKGAKQSSDSSHHESFQEPLTVKEASQLEIKEKYVSTSSSSSDDENRTFSIHKSKEKSDSEKLNRTFSIEKDVESFDGNTYELKKYGKDDLNDDATSISDAFD